MKKNIGLIVKFYFVEFGKSPKTRTMYVTAYGASKKKALRNAFDQVFLYRSNSRYTYHEVIHAYEA
jgi:hypothetical protein